MLYGNIQTNKETFEYTRLFALPNIMTSALSSCKIYDIFICSKYIFVNKMYVYINTKSTAIRKRNRRQSRIGKKSNEYRQQELASDWANCQPV